MNSKPVILSLESLLKALKTKELFNINRLNLQPHLLYKTQHLKNLHAHVYIKATGVWSPAREVEALFQIRLKVLAYQTENHAVQ